ncbi:MAG: hypothetical protein K9G49_01060 [Taibaiella sp.]|nr:hypothetical protein [Taibaiella sp.]
MAEHPSIKFDNRSKEFYTVLKRLVDGYFRDNSLNNKGNANRLPKTICHVHYPKLSKIVATTAAEFNLPYNSKKTFVSAIYSHIKTLYRLGRA